MKISIDGITWKQRYQIKGMLKAMMDAGKTEMPVWIAFHCDPGFCSEIRVDGSDKIDSVPDAQKMSGMEARNVSELGETIVIYSDGKTAE